MSTEKLALKQPSIFKKFPGLKKVILTAAVGLNLAIPYDVSKANFFDDLIDELSPSDDNQSLEISQNTKENAECIKIQPADNESTPKTPGSITIGATVLAVIRCNDDYSSCITNDYCASDYNFEKRCHTNTEPCKIDVIKDEKNGTVTIINSPDNVHLPQ